MSERFVNIGVANTARVHLDENLIRTRLGLWNVLNHGPFTAVTMAARMKFLPRDSMSESVDWILSDSVGPSSAFHHVGMSDIKMLGV